MVATSHWTPRVCQLVVVFLYILLSSLPQPRQIKNPKKSEGNLLLQFLQRDIQIETFYISNMGC